MDKKKTMLCLGASGALCAGALLIRSAYECRTLSVSEYLICSDKIRKDRTIAFLTDLHDNVFGEDQEDLLCAVRNASPDWILIGGDMIVTKGHSDPAVALSLIGRLAADHPVYYANGNHESRMRWQREVYADSYERFIKALTDMGVHYLADSYEDPDEDFRIYGLDLLEGHYRKFKADPMESSFIADRLGDTDDDKFNILLAHSPLFEKEYADWGADLTLCGHFHGGVVRIPYIGGLITPQFMPFSDLCDGIHYIGDKAMIVSRGLGTHSVNIRLNNKPELVLVSFNKR